MQIIETLAQKGQFLKDIANCIIPIYSHCVIAKKKKTSSSSKYFRPAYSISCNNPGSDLAGEAQSDIAI